MAIIRKKDLKDMTKDEILARLKELEIELLKAKTGKAKKTPHAKNKEMRKTIAKLLTALKTRI